MLQHVITQVRLILHQTDAIRLRVQLSKSKCQYIALRRGFCATAVLTTRVVFAMAWVPCVTLLPLPSHMPMLHCTRPLHHSCLATAAPSRALCPLRQRLPTCRMPPLLHARCRKCHTSAWQRFRRPHRLHSLRCTHRHSALCESASMPAPLRLLTSLHALFCR